MSYVHQLDLSPVFISFPLFCLWTLPALFSGFVTKRRGGAIRRKMNVLLACRQILPFQNTKQICVCACPVILQLTCALRVGLWDPFNDRDGQRWRQVEDSAVWLVWSACVCVCACVFALVSKLSHILRCADRHAGTRWCHWCCHWITVSFLFLWQKKEITPFVLTCSNRTLQ